MRLLMMSFGFLALSQCVGCGDGSDVPEALRAPPEAPIKNAAPVEGAPVNSMPAEEH